MQNLRIVLSAALLGLIASPVFAQGGFGTRVAAGAGVVYIAEPNNIARSGLVYVYTPGSDGKWSETAKIAAPDASIADRFGAALAASGQMLLASRLSDNEGRGATYVFERRGNSWQNIGRLTANDAAPNDSVGAALALGENVALLGAPAGNEKKGAVYVLRRAADGRWEQEAKLTASDGQAGDGFGRAVALSGDRILVGAPGQAKNRGGVYLFVHQGNTWKEEGRMVARTVSENSLLGSSVAILRDWFIASAPGRDENTGAVYLFEKNPQAPGYAAYQRLFPFEAASNSRFGNQISVVNDELWIGSPGADQFRGTIYRFHYDNDAQDWTLTRKLSYFDPKRGAGGFAGAFAVSGNVAISGLPNSDFGAGSAVVLTRAPDGEWKPQGEVMSQPESFARVSGRARTCENSKAADFECGNVDLLGFLPLSAIGGKRGVQLSGIWGWTDAQSGREYALVGRMDGTSFVDVSDPSNPVYLGDLPLTQGANPNIWREIKVYKDHAYIVADGAGKHGMQVFDLTQLRSVKDAPVTFKPTMTYEGIFSAHNIVINEDKGFAYATGSNGGANTCGGALHMIDIRQPRNPKFVGCFADPLTGIQKTGYTHDAQCVTYKGPDAKYKGREICFNSSETALGISDVTDKAKPVAISRASYPNVQYSHQGWLSEDHRYFYMNDEGDEASGVVPKTRTIIWDLTDLDDPQVLSEFFSPTGAIDHNLYIKGDTMYQSHYVAGLRIVDIKDKKNPKEIGFLDSVPNSPNSPTFAGSWSNYPFFKSGTIVFTSMREGLFIVKYKQPRIVS
jgi:choice-of-anchor B domain-containing protein